MRSSIATFITCASLFGCEAPPGKVPSSNVSRPVSETIATIPVARTQTRRMPLVGGACPLFFPPHEMGSVVHIPAKMMSIAMDPVMSALCSCTKPGEYSAIVAQIDFGLGRVQVRAPDAPTINECLESLPVTFVPIPESELPSSDCIGCGPRFYGVFGDSPPPPKASGLRLLYSFLLDRSGELLNCPDHTHTERGECKPNVDASLTVQPKQSCGCSATDLACAIACEATK